MTTVNYNPLSNTSAQFKQAHVMVLAKNTPIESLWLAVSGSSIKIADDSQRGILGEMHKQNGRAELANQAKALEEKIKAAAKNAGAADKDKLSGKGWNTAQDDAKKLAEVYKQLGINGGDLKKLETGDFTLLDMEAMQTTSKGVSDSATSANQMLNLELSKQNNFYNQSINLATKAVENLKSLASMILGTMGR
jgi:hypothetical protein